MIDLSIFFLLSDYLYDLIDKYYRILFLFLIGIAVFLDKILLNSAIPITFRICLFSFFWLFLGILLFYQINEKLAISQRILIAYFELFPIFICYNLLIGLYSFNMIQMKIIPLLLYVLCILFISWEQLFIESIISYFIALILIFLPIIMNFLVIIPYNILIDKEISVLFLIIWLIILYISEKYRKISLIQKKVFS